MGNVGNELYIPNAFTPNGDDDNNVFFAYGLNIKTLTMQIFSRWGELLYETNDKTKGWNGKYKEQFVEIGVYVYRIQCEWMDGNSVRRIGSVTVIK